MWCTEERRGGGRRSRLALPLGKQLIIYHLIDLGFSGRYNTDPDLSKYTYADGFGSRRQNIADPLLIWFQTTGINSG